MTSETKKKKTSSVHQFMHTKSHTHDTFPLCPLKFKNISLFSDPKPDSDEKIPVEHTPALSEKP